MNRFSKTESAVFKLSMLYLQRILFTEYSIFICFMFNENRLVCFLFNIKNDLKKSAYDDITTLFRCQLCTIKEIKKNYSHFVLFLILRRSNSIIVLRKVRISYIAQESENSHFAQDNSRKLKRFLLCAEHIHICIQVRFINLIPMHFFHKSLHTPWCIPSSTTR